LHILQLDKQKHISVPYSKYPSYGDICAAVQKELHSEENCFSLWLENGEHCSPSVLNSKSPTTLLLLNSPQKPGEEQTELVVTKDTDKGAGERTM